MLLFNYLLSHEKQYSMEVIRLEPVFLEPNAEFDNEYVLVQISSHKVTYRDHQVPMQPNFQAQDLHWFRIQCI